MAEKDGERFITPGPLPTNRQREILIILMEECAEVQHRAAKALRFGLGEIQPGHDQCNAERLANEVGDLFGIVGLAVLERVIDEDTIRRSNDRKIDRLKMYMQTEENDG